MNILVMNSIIPIREYNIMIYDYNILRMFESVRVV